MDFKTEILKILEPIFGKNVNNILKEYYDNPQEMYDVALQMLSGYMGEENALKKLKPLLEHNPKIKAR